MKQGDIVYYRDEQNDDFANNGISAVKITKDFPFEPKGLVWRIAEFFAYYGIAIPIVALIWLVTGFTIRGRGNIRALRKELKSGGRGFFLYANHTHWLDAFAGPLVCFPKKSYVLVSPDTVSIKGIRTFLQMLGAIPVPTERDAIPPFTEAIESRIDQGRAVMIFPEAHIWPFCGFVRDFKAGSFRYPAKLGVPIVCVCVTYKRRRGLGKLRNSPRREVFISEPLYPDPSLPAPLAKQKLRDEAYEWLKRTAEEQNEIEYVKYVKQDDTGK